MHRRLLGLAVFACCAFGANASERGWYASIEGGVNWTDADIGGIVAYPLCSLLFPCTTDTSTDPGWAAFGAVGIAVGENLRVEAEVGHRVSGLGDRGDITNTTLMLNGRFDVPVSDAMALSLGGGIGVDWVQTELSQPNPFSTDSDTVFAYQLIAGASYALSDRLDVTLTYRYLGTSSMDTLYANVGIDGAAGLSAVASVVDVDASTVSIGLEFAL